MAKKKKTAKRGAGPSPAAAVLQGLHESPWLVPSLALPAAGALAVMAEADYVSKQYAALINFIDTCPFYTHSSGLIVALAHRYPGLARTMFPNPAFPDACVLLTYTPRMRKHMDESSRRIIPRLFTFAQPENGGLSLTAKELAEKALAATCFGSEDEATAAVLPCPVPSPPEPLYPAAAAAVAFASLGVTSVFSSDPKHWWTALVVGALVGAVISWLRQRRIRDSAARYKNLCVVGI